MMRLYTLIALALMATGPHAWAAVDPAAAQTEIDRLTAMVRAQPYRPDLAVKRAQSFAALGRYEDALNELDFALWKQPSNPSAVALVKQYLSEWVGRDATLIQLNASLTAQPGNADLFVQRGDRLAAIADMVRQFSDAVTARLAEPTFTSAREAYDRALAVNAEHSEAWRGKAELARRFDRHVEAVAAAQRAVHADAGNAAAHSALVRSLLVIKRPADAEKQFGVLMKMPMRSAKDYAIRARLCADIGPPDQARIEYEHAIELEPKNAAYHYAHGKVILDIEKKAQVRGFGIHGTPRQDFDAALNIDPNHISARYYLANVYYRRGRYAAFVERNRPNFDAATAQLTRLLEVDPRHVSSYIVRGECHLVMGREKEAKQDFAIAVQINPDKAAMIEDTIQYWRKESAEYNEVVARIISQITADLERYARDGFATVCPACGEVYLSKQSHPCPKR